MADDEELNQEEMEEDEYSGTQGDYYDPHLGRMGETVDEDELSERRKKIFQRQEQRLSTKLDQIIKRIPNRIFPYLWPWEKMTVEKAKSHEKLRPKLTQLSLLIGISMVKVTSKVISTIGPVIPYIIIGGLIILASIAAATAIDMALKSLFGGDESGGSSPMGPKGKDFYAVRAVYSDDEQAEIDQINDYIDLLRGVGDKINQDITSQNLEITFNLPLPTEEEMEKFVEDKNTGEYIISYEIMTEMADVVYKYDNAGGTETDLSKKLVAIKYFGYDSLLLNKAGENNDLADVLKANFLQHKDQLFAPKSEGGDLPIDLMTKIDASVDAYVSTVPNVRAEKYYLQDFVLDTDDKVMSGIKSANYVSIVLYARKDFSAQYMQFMVANIDVEKFDISIVDNGEEKEFNITPKNNDDFFNKGINKEQIGNGKMYNYEISRRFTIPQSSEPEYLNSLDEEKDSFSVYEIVKKQLSALDSSSFVQKAKDGSGQTIENIYSYKIDGFAIQTEYDGPFGFSITLEPKSF